MFALILIAMVALLAWINFSVNTAAIIVLIAILGLAAYAFINAKTQKNKAKKILKSRKSEEKD